MKKMMFVLCFALLFVGACKEFLHPDRDAFLGEWQCAWIKMSISEGKKRNEIVIDTFYFYCNHFNIVGKVDENSASFDTYECTKPSDNDLIIKRFYIKQDTLNIACKVTDTENFTFKFNRL